MKKKIKNISIILVAFVAIFVIPAAESLMDLAWPRKITLSSSLSSKNFENYPEIKRTLIDLYNSNNPEQWSKDHPDRFYPMLEFLNDYTIWELQQPTSAAKAFFNKLANENNRQLICLE